MKDNTTLAGFLYGLEHRGVGIEPTKNKQGKTYGICFSYDGHTFKASEIGHTADHHHSHGGGLIESLSEGAVALLGSLFSLNPSPAAEDDNAPSIKKKPKKRRRYGQQQ